MHIICFKVSQFLVKLNSLTMALNQCFVFSDPVFTIGSLSFGK